MYLYRHDVNTNKTQLSPRGQIMAKPSNTNFSTPSVAAATVAGVLLGIAVGELRMQKWKSEALREKEEAVALNSYHNHLKTVNLVAQMMQKTQEKKEEIAHLRKDLQTIMTGHNKTGLLLGQKYSELSSERKEKEAIADEANLASAEIQTLSQQIEDITEKIMALERQMSTRAMLRSSTAQTLSPL